MRFYCKSNYRQHKTGSLDDLSKEELWKDVFIKGKYYNAVPSRWGKWKAIGEREEILELSKAEFNIIFETKKVDIRERLINDLLND